MQGGSNVKFLEIQKAYEILLDPKQLKKYKEPNMKENIEFNKQWNLIYGENSLKIEKLKKNINTSKRVNLFLNPFRYFDLILTKHKLIKYQEEINNEEKK
jgi:DnaJ-class molecular chaperone